MEESDRLISAIFRSDFMALVFTVGGTDVD